MAGFCNLLGYSEMPHKRLVRKLSTEGDVESWIKNWLRVYKQSLGVNKEFQCDEQRDEVLCY